MSMSLVNREGAEKTDASMKLEPDTSDPSTVVDRNEKMVVMSRDVVSWKIVAAEQIFDAGTVSRHRTSDPDLSGCGSFLQRSSWFPDLAGQTRYSIV